MLVTHACDLLCLQLHTVESLYTVHASDLLCLQLHTVWSPHMVHASDTCWCLAVPTAAHSMVSTHGKCFRHMLMSCCAYSCTQYGLHTWYMLLTHADVLLCLQLHTVWSPHMVHASDTCWCLAVLTAAHSSLHIQYMLLTHADVLLCLQLHTVWSPHTVHASDTCWCLAVLTAHTIVSIYSTCFWLMFVTCCAYSCTQYGLNT